MTNEEFLARMRREEERQERIIHRLEKCVQKFNLAKYRLQLVKEIIKSWEENPPHKSGE